MPNSILWIGLVVLWVFVLFPMLANRHPRIRQHTDAALSTRVLHRGGAEQRTRKGPATGHDTDPDYVPVRRKLHPSEDPEDRMTRSDDAAASDEKEVDTEAAPIAEAQTPPAEAPEPEGDSADVVEAADIAAESESEPAESETVAETATAAGESENDEAVADDADRKAEREERQEAPQRARTPALREPDPAPEPEPEFEDEDPDFVPSRRGRGGFDPEADAAARAARYTFRQRAVLGLALATLILAAAGLAVSAVLWWLCALSGTVLVTYLGYLRRQVRIEEDIRRRRAARLARKGAEDGEGEEESRRREHPRPDREQTRTQLRRAVLVESDDEDPLFEHLELFDAAAARATRQRAAGARERRAVGE
ncbi:gephyrin-like molybdotransferase receptor GlpR [Nocardia sp. NPDC101769]|uniref:divisome protein SepX/GlpR n=1 Tax=Nocardia sp. NPDC101769 TaxID=3364333 RepID=UPI0037FD7200